MTKYQPIFDDPFRWHRLDGLLPLKDEEGEIRIWKEEFGCINTFPRDVSLEKTRYWNQATYHESTNIFGKYKVTKWDKIFFKTATEWSLLSPDAQTKCGCVLVTGKEILSTGYNGFMRDLDIKFDKELPKKRPEKYPYMIHAEQNAIYNAARQGRQTIEATAYITGMPCGVCLQALYQAGIKEIKFTDVSEPKMVVYGEDYDNICRMAWQSGMLKKYFPKELIF